MTISVPDLMRETRNYFPAASLDASWTLRSTALAPINVLHPGDWIAITDSLHNNGVFQLGQNCTIPGAADETWQGRVWLLAPPADFLTLAQEISTWVAQQGNGLAVKETFGAYSRELATDGVGQPLTWQARFSRQLLPYRRMYTEVKL